MSFGTFDPQRQPAMMSDINVTPMVDVILVLLVIFILAAPLFTHRVEIALPVAGASAGQQPAGLVIAIDAAGTVYADGEPMSAQALDQRLAQAAQATPPPELQLHADRSTRYEVVAQVMAAAQAHKLTNIAFITDPNKEHYHGKR